MPGGWNFRGSCLILPLMAVQSDIGSHMGVFEKFNEAKEKDRKFVKGYLANWKYQSVNRRRKLKMAEDSVGDYLTYNGPQDLVNWMKWISRPLPNVYGSELIRKWVEISRKRDEAVVEKLRLPFDFADYDRSIGVFNAFDYHFT